MPSVPQRAEPPLGAVRRLTAALLFLGAVAHSGFLAEAFLDTALSPWHTVPARLASAGQPYSDVFRYADCVAGAAFVLAGPSLFRIAPVHWQGRLTVTVLSAYGVVLLLRAAFPPECLPDDAGRCVSQGGASDLLVLLAGVQYVVGPLIVGGWWRGRWKRITLALFVIQFALWAVVVGASWLLDGRFVGVAARLQVLGASVLFGAGVVYILRMGRRAAGVRRPAEVSSREGATSCPG
ncbi:hypothetical protein AB8O38_03345 [Saccharomonospora xinjiangensis]|uniref:hypothetical protein n=1 Tax=Saccharomonospora xinjiangensis TaxID=75294 RepID=UPI00350FDD67